jgi:hypothetical protein
MTERAAGILADGSVPVRPATKGGSGRVKGKGMNGEGECGGIDPYTLMAAHGPRHRRWPSPQDEDLRSTTEFSVHCELQVVLDIV